jgi:hypothetical protein
MHWALFRPFFAVSDAQLQRAPRGGSPAAVIDCARFTYHVNEVAWGGVSRARVCVGRILELMNET